MNDKGCNTRFLSVAYPKHVRRPEDVLSFIETSQFADVWDRLKLDCEDDAVSLQLCTMAGPKDWPVIKGSGGLRLHIHSFLDTGIEKPDVKVYYVYYETFGIVQFFYLDEDAEELDFTDDQLNGIRVRIARVKEELKRRRTIR